MRSKENLRRGSRCIDQIFVLKQLDEKYREERKELNIAFMDMEKGYDKVCREAMGECCMNVELMGT